MSIFGKIGSAVGLGAVKQARQALGVMSPHTASGLGLSRMPGANVQGGIAPGMGSLKGIAALVRNPKRGQPTPPPAAGPAAPPPPGMEAMAQGAGQMAQMGMGQAGPMKQMGTVPGGASAPALQSAMQQMGQSGPPPQPFLESVQQAIAPSEFSDPYEAQKQRRIRGY